LDTSYEHTAADRASPDTAGSSCASISPSKQAFDAEIMALLGLSRFEGIGFKSLYRLGGRERIRSLLESKDVAAFDKAIADAGGKFSVAAAGGDWAALRHNIWRHGTALAGELNALGVGCAFEGDRCYPKAFADISPAMRPHWIFWRGDLSLLDRACLTIVGTREQSDAGEWLARYAVACAKELNAPVISGLARGIDRTVHDWCLRLQLATVSVMGTGILTVYPAKHAGLGEEIVQAGGLLLTEYLPDQGPSAENFVRRNQLQAALGRAVVPAEWAKKSGTAHTVRYARDLSRAVFSVSLSGLRRAPDAGDGDRHFAVPRDHIGFVDALRAAVEKDGRPVVPTAVQFGFSFGDE
jgi:DNA protecting protein DprA